MLPGLSDSNADVRQQALSTIEELEGVRSPSRPCIGLMRDPDADVRQQAAHLAGERSVIGAIPTLRRMLDDTNADVRESAVDALGNIADGAADRRVARGAHIEGREGSPRRGRSARRPETMIMRTISILLVSTAIGAGAVGAAVKMNPGVLSRSATGTIGRRAVRARIPAASRS